MDEDELSEIDAALIRSRLHIRGGKKLLDHDKIVHGIGTLYDAVEYGMRYWYYMNKSKLNLPEVIVGNPHEIYDLLLKYNVVSSNFNFLEFQKVMEESLEYDFDGSKFERKPFLEIAESVLTSVNVLPFAPEILPKENDDTRKILGIDE